MGTQWSDKLKLAAQAILPPGRRLQAPIDLVTFKQLTKGSGFGRTVQCLPGQITVIQDRESNRAESFRGALIGKSQKTTMSVRIGPEELRRSEMLIVGGNDFVWEARSVFDALRKGGVPERKMEQRLKEVGLGSKGNHDPKGLTPAELKKLSILHSLFARARLLVYDRPFGGLDPSSVHSLSRMMIESAEQQNRVLLVVGEMSIPPLWVDNPMVALVTPERMKMRDDLGLTPTDENQRLAELVRNLSGNGNVGSVTIGRAAVPVNIPTDIVTRPQMIFDATRPKNQSVVRSELIDNPNLPPEVREIHKARSDSKVGIEIPSDDGSNESKGRDTTRINRSPSGRLTQVTWRKRMKRFRAATGMRRALRDLLYLSGPAVRDGQGDPVQTPAPSVDMKYRNIVCFLLLLLFMLVLFGSFAVLMHWRAM